MLCDALVYSTIFFKFYKLLVFNAALPVTNFNSYCLTLGVGYLVSSKYV